jgi:hypothetical protein
MKRHTRKETVDKVAAAIILQTFLDAKNDPRNEDDPPVARPPGIS